MVQRQWGLCKDCKWWQIEPESAIENLTLGLCIEEKLQAFRLRVSGLSGCLAPAKRRPAGGPPANGPSGCGAPCRRCSTCGKPVSSANAPRPSPKSRGPTRPTPTRYA